MMHRNPIPIIRKELKRLAAQEPTGAIAEARRQGAEDALNRVLRELREPFWPGREHEHGGAVYRGGKAPLSRFRP